MLTTGPLQEGRWGLHWTLHEDWDVLQLAERVSESHQQFKR